MQLGIEGPFGMVCFLQLGSSFLSEICWFFMRQAALDMEECGLPSAIDLVEERGSQ